MGFESNFSQHLSGIFGVMSESVTYTPSGGVASTVRGIILYSNGEAGLYNTGIAAPLFAIDVQISEVENPNEGDAISYSGTDYTIKSVELSDDRHIWRLFLKESS